MRIDEAKHILLENGFICETRGKTNIEDFNKMKSDVSQVTNIPGKNFEFVTGNVKGSVEDERSTMIIGWGNRGEYTYDTGRPGFSRYRKISKEKVLDIIKEKQKEIEQLGYNVEFVENNVKIWMPKSDLKPAEDETEMTLFGIFNDGGNCWSSRDDDGHWYWSASEGETAKEFRARLARAGERKAQENYREYVKGSYGVRVFKNIEDFKKACAKVGLHPNLSDYE